MSENEIMTLMSKKQLYLLETENDYMLVILTIKSKNRITILSLTSWIKTVHYPRSSSCS